MEITAIATLQPPCDKTITTLQGSDTTPRVPNHHADHIDIQSVLDVSRFNAFPPAARLRELTKAANTFASSGKNVFIHYTQPILTKHRALLLQSRTTKKLFHKTAAQLWSIIGHDEEFFWNQQAKNVRLSLKQKVLSVEECLRFAGSLGDARTCVWHGEVAVSGYLGTALPATLENFEVSPPSMKRELPMSEPTNIDVLETAIKDLPLSPTCTITTLDLQDDEQTEHSSGTQAADTLPKDYGLLDVLPSPFKLAPKSLHGNLATLDHAEIRQASGRIQTVYLRRVSQMLDDTGKELFCYYMVPRLCATIQPRLDGSTVVSIAADVWRFLNGERKGVWCAASVGLKKRLGDGDAEGLMMLELESLDEEVLRLHEVARGDWESQMLRKTKERDA